MSNYYDPGTGDWVVVDGAIVERDALRIAERIKEYDENLDIICLDSDLAFHDLSDAPFIIICRRPNGTYYKVFETWSLDERVVERVAMADGNRVNLFDHAAALQAARQKTIQDRYKETQLENTDQFMHAMVSKQNTYTLKNAEDKLVRIHADRPPTTVSSETTVTHGPVRKV